MADWMKITIHLLAWIVPGIWMWKMHRSMFFYCLLVFGGFALGAVATGSPLYPLFWAIYAFMGLFSAINLKGWWFWIGIVSTLLTSWAVIQYIFTGTIFWF